jgi:hypothetical protein
VSVSASSSDGRKVVAPSDALAAALPDEMTTEVLLRLPIKSILRFRAVSRTWAALLSSEEFCGSTWLRPQRRRHRRSLHRGLLLLLATGRWPRARRPAPAHPPVRQRQLRHRRGASAVPRPVSSTTPAWRAHGRRSPRPTTSATRPHGPSRGCLGVRRRSTPPPGSGSTRGPDATRWSGSFSAGWSRTRTSSARSTLSAVRIVGGADRRRSALQVQASFVSIGLIPTGIDKCNMKIMIDTIRDPDLFRVEN